MAKEMSMAEAVSDMARALEFFNTRPHTERNRKLFAALFVGGQSVLLLQGCCGSLKFLGGALAGGVCV